jgi:hypothetical protein
MILSFVRHWKTVKIQRRLGLLHNTNEKLRLYNQFANNQNLLLTLLMSLQLLPIHDV